MEDVSQQLWRPQDKLCSPDRQMTSTDKFSCLIYIVLVLNVYEVYSTALFLKKKISKLCSKVTHSLSKDVSSCTRVEP